jgi:hypothetical protein
VKLRSLIITRTPAEEGTIFEVASPEGARALTVDLALIKAPLFGIDWLKRLQTVVAYRLVFPEANSIGAVVAPNSPTVEFFSRNGEPQGLARWARFSLIGRFVVADENGKEFGAVDYGPRRDRLLSPDGQELGSIRRRITPSTPKLLWPSQSHLADRFEYTTNCTTSFDDRLLLTWLASQAVSKFDTGGS